LDELVGH